MIAQTDRVYKPTYTIEFNREGEVLLYSANPVTTETIYFKYPYILCNCIANSRRVPHPTRHPQLRPQPPRHGVVLDQLPPLWKFGYHHPQDLVLLRLQVDAHETIPPERRKSAQGRGPERGS